MFISTFSRTFKSLRASAGYTQDEMAKKIGVAPSSIGMYERGERKPSVDILIEIATTFGVSIDYLVGYKKGEGFDDETMEEWVGTGKTMTDVQRKKWLKAVKAYEDNT